MKTITKREYKAAKKIVDRHKSQFYRELISDYVCICCRKNKIKPLKGCGLDSGSIKPTEQQRGMWDSGTVSLLSFGFGSKHDLQSFYVAICDECIEQLNQEGLTVNFKELAKVANSI